MALPYAARSNFRRTAMQRSTFLATLAALACSSLALPAAAQNEPLRVGFLTVRSGPLAPAAGRWKKASSCS